MKYPGLLRRYWIVGILVCMIPVITTLFPPVSAPRADAGDTVVLLAGELGVRVPAAAAAFHKYRAERILLTNDGVLSGWSPAHQRNLYNVEWAEEELVSRGIPRSAIVKLPFYGSSTLNDALAVRVYAREHRLRSFVLVTSGYHLQRALWTFAKVFRGTGVAIAASSAPAAPGLYGRLLEFGKTLYYGCRFGFLRSIPEPGPSLATFPPTLP